ncbi:MAG: ABC transporter permease [Candidatus Geothermarchaeales archaeon]
MTDLFRQSWKALANRKFRSLLTIVMVAVGAMLITGLNGMSLGLNQYIEDRLAVAGADTLNVFPSTTTTMKVTDFVVSRISAIPGVKAAMPYVQRSVTIRSGGESEHATLMGIDQSNLPLIYPSLELNEGNYVSESDQIGILLGKRLAYPQEESAPFASFNTGVVVEFVTTEEKGSTKRVLHIVRGVLEYTGFPLVDRAAFVSLRTARYLFNTGSEYSGIYVVAEDPAWVDEIEREILSMYKRNFMVFTPKEMAKMIQQIMGSLSMFTGSIASVSLLVATVGILTTMYTSVRERTREIGITKSIGFTDRMVMTLFLFEAMIIGIAGGTIGIIGGVFLSHVLSSLIGSYTFERPAGLEGGLGHEATMTGLTPIFDPITLAMVWALCLALSLVGGAYPAWKASRLNPIDALRAE